MDGDHTPHQPNPGRWLHSDRRSPRSPRRGKPRQMLADGFFNALFRSRPFRDFRFRPKPALGPSQNVARLKFFDKGPRPRLNRRRPQEGSLLRHPGRRPSNHPPPLVAPRLYTAIADNQLLGRTGHQPRNNQQKRIDFSRRHRSTPTKLSWDNGTRQLPQHNPHALPGRRKRCPIPPRLFPPPEED